MQDQVQALGENILTGHTLSEQVMDLREIRAALRERVSATDCALRDARLQIINLQHKDQEQSSKISTLEDSLAHTRAHIDHSSTLLRFQELDTRNKDLEREMASARAKATSLTKQVETTSDDLEGLQGRIADTQSQLEEARRETEVLRIEKSSCEQQATRQLEQLRKELANVRKELNTKPKQSLTEEKLSHVTKQFSLIKADKEKAEQETAQMKASYESMLKEREREVRLIRLLLFVLRSY